MKSNEQLPEITLKFDEFGAEDGLSGFMMFVKHCNWPIDISFVEMENGDKLAVLHRNGYYDLDLADGGHFEIPVRAWNSWRPDIMYHLNYKAKAEFIAWIKKEHGYMDYYSPSK
jgi:hypothetical protein